MLKFKRPLYATERTIYSLRPRMLRLPDFIMIGSAQSGSTWMFRNFESHPDIFVPRKKEVHYFTRNFRNVSLHNYSSNFTEAGGRICGELTPAYMLLPPDRIRFIHRIIPDVRLILTIRHPIGRAWSGARRVMAQIANASGTSVEDIADAEYFAYFDKEWDYKPERHPPSDLVPGMLHAHYCRAIDNWTEIFPAEQLLICFFDDIKRDPQALMRRVLRHVGARTDVDWSSFSLRKKINQNPKRDIPEKYRHYLEDLYAGEIAELQRRFPENTADWTVSR